MQRASAIIALIFFASFTFIDDAVTCALMPIPDECLEVLEACDDMFVMDSDPICIVVVSGCGGCAPPITLIPDMDPDYPYEMLDNQSCAECCLAMPETRPVIVEYRIFQYQYENNIALPENIFHTDISKQANTHKSLNPGIHPSIPSTVLRC
ncbi:MAG: hypothetical protein V3V99_06115 [candidate division Zixibacteria bacterium]